MTMEIFSKLEQQWLSTQTTLNSDTKKTKILSIDGGGISASIAASFLVHLEETIQSKTGVTSARVVDFFDIIAGTGVGAILAVLITAADTTTGRPLFSAAEAVSFLSLNAGKLFKPRRSGVFRRDAGKFSGESLGSILKLTFKNLTLKDTCKPILIPCYDIVSSAPFVFSRAAASASSLDFELWKVCTAAVATPAVFDPFTLSSVDGKKSIVAVDGGVVMNNPTAAAVTHVLHNKVEFPTVNGVEDLLVLSLGNGTLSCRGVGENWGGNSKKMTKCVVDVAVDGVSETVDQMLGNAFSCNRNDYVRIQANGFDESGPMTMDKALKERCIESLTFGGKRLLPETNADRIDGFVQRLISASPKTSLPPSPYKSLTPLLDGR
ncbi:hypothetical protein KSS87_006918 [Heliosperma pusillum]|nr:hypothetical protein KSS87_006918 [Heliosperma pusillum]